LFKVLNKFSGGKSPLLFIVAGCVFVFCLSQTIFSFIENGKKKAEIELIETKIVEQTFENNELKKVIESGNQDEYIERIAREKLGLVMPDERVFVNTMGE